MDDEKFLQRLLDNNEKWAKSISETDPGFFAKSSKGPQCPKVVWFGCSDSRVPAETIVQLKPGEMFVHRNIANQFIHTDLNSLSVLEYAVNALKVEHIIVCGHSNCGGVIASMGQDKHGLVDNWLLNIKDIHRANKSLIDPLEREKQVELLVELNVKRQVDNISATSIVQDAWASGRKLKIHGWVYCLSTGKLKDLKKDINGVQDLDQISKFKIC